MHVILRDQEVSGEESIMCVERNSQTAIVLKGDFDRLDQLVSIAASMKVPKVCLLVDSTAVDAFKEVGWEVSDLVVLEKKASKTK